jgi:hypothetical protein
MMRAFENRPDTEVFDEPFYGYYLAQTGINHPGAEEIISQLGSDWRPIADKCASFSPEGKSIFFQKHMTLHFLPNINHKWMEKLTHFLLIRDPHEVIASYTKVRSKLTLMDIGIVQQAELYDLLTNVKGVPPPILESRDVLIDPRSTLTALCKHLKIDFSEEMLKWPSGKRITDGIWGQYWYSAVWQSTGFRPYEKQEINLSKSDKEIAERAMPYYTRLYENRILTTG